MEKILLILLFIPAFIYPQDTPLIEEKVTTEKMEKEDQQEKDYKKSNSFVFAQECYPEKNKQKRLVKKIERLIDKRAYYDAVDALQKASSAAVFFVLGSEVLWRRGDFFNAEDNAFKAIDICPDNFPKAYYFLGKIAYNRKDYVNADIYLRKAINLQISDPYYSDAIMLYENAKILAKIINNPVKFNPQIVNGISTKDDEYLPIISPDQELSFFTRRSDRASLQSITKATVEEFIFSKRVSGNFEVGKALSYPFNIESNEGGASITIDNRTLYYTKCIRDKRGYNNCDIYYVNRENGIWSDIQEFPKNISRIDSWESQPTVSSDGRTIIFSSDRVGGYGKMDLYEINKVDGDWTKPENLGSTINSNEYEKSPYLHTDGKTLFFASTNFPTLGGFDIFYSRKDSLGNWQNPINIGFPINTVGDEISLFVSTDGDEAYFAANNLDREGGWDIYSFILYDGAKPERVLFLKGDLFDKNKQLVEDIELEIKNIKTQQITTIKVNAGTYVSSLTLAEDADVLITIKKQGFAFHSTYISAEDTSFDSPSDLNFEMQSLEEGKSFNIDNVYFDNNSYEVKRITKEILIEFAKYLEVNKTLVIEINGFTDNVGDKIDNQLLSENRAKAVKNILLIKGISEHRVSYNGFGESSPISSKDVEGGRKKNRRTEFKIISQ
jgi:outer membrane protein OmpA-like peptidoglycan-associated protein/tetratricopeptide (TPR) repeat protein